MEIVYQEYQPSVHLKPYIDCFWSHSFINNTKGTSPVQRCLPLGGMEMIFLVEDVETAAFINGQWVKLPDAYFVGLYENAVLWKTSGDSVKFGVRLTPEAVIQLFNTDVAELPNKYVELEDFFGNEIKQIVERIKEASTIRERINVIEYFLTLKLSKNNIERNYLVEALRRIRQSKGNLSIENLSKDLYISERQLQRRFKDNVGLNPKTYLRIIRFKHAYDYMQANPNYDWTDISYGCGYSDQAHFIRDFKEFSGEIPTALVEKERVLQKMFA